MQSMSVLSLSDLLSALPCNYQSEILPICLHSLCFRRPFSIRVRNVKPSGLACSSVRCQNSASSRCTKGDRKQEEEASSLMDSPTVHHVSCWFFSRSWCASNATTSGKHSAQCVGFVFTFIPTVSPCGRGRRGAGLRLGLDI